MNPLIEFREVHRCYGKKHVLRGLSFHVRPGEVYALLGRNGAGKTTALRTLLGFLTPNAGGCELFGLDSRDLTSERRERVGFVSEGHKIPDFRTVRTTLTYEAATRRRFDARYARAQIDRCKIPLGQKVSTLSAGQTALLSIVLAFAGRPEILVFDDPAMGLDPVVRREVLEALLELMAGAGATVLFTSHMLADVERIVDRVGILSDGRLLIDATVEDMRNRIEHRFLRTDVPTRIPDHPAVIQTRRREHGAELTLIDPQPEIVAMLEALGELGEHRPASLEDSFIALTRDRDGLTDELPNLPGREEVVS